MFALLFLYVQALLMTLRASTVPEAWRLTDDGLGGLCSHSLGGVSACARDDDAAEF